jgi:hypothetical protein
MAEPEDAAIAALRTALQDADPNAKASLIGGPPYSDPNID